MSSITLALAGLRIRLNGPREPLAGAAARYEPYLADGTPDLSMDWTVGEPPRTDRWPDPAVTRGEISRRDFHARIEGGRGIAITNGHPMALDSLLRVVLSELLADRGGVLVHAAAVGSRLFPGVTGAGKTTLASLVPKGEVLSDEITAVVPAGSGFDLCATPFWGSFARGTSRERHPLEAIYFLEREEAERIASVVAADAAGKLLECVLCFVDDDDRARRMLDAAARIVTRVPAWSLSYDANRTRWPELRGRLSAVR